MLIHEVKKALEQKRTFDVRGLKYCDTFDVLLQFLPQLFCDIDNTLLDGALGKYFKANDITFKVVSETGEGGPAGLTTYDAENGMIVHIHKKAWVNDKAAFPAMVGGNLCHRADTCLVHIMCHEFVHVLLFAIYLELDLSTREIASSIASHYDPTHNVLFTTWLERFFGHDTIDNSLLLHGNNDEPMVFKRTVRQIEKECVFGEEEKSLTAFYKGSWRKVTLMKDVPAPKKPHHSNVRDERTGKMLVIPNGLLRC